MNSPRMTWTEEDHHFNEYEIPPYMRGGLDRYINDRIQPGHFLTAVLENKLVEALGHADSTNIRNLPAYVSFLYNHVPSSCWGSPVKVEAWLKGEDKS